MGLCTMIPVVDMSYKEIAEKLNEIYKEEQNKVRKININILHAKGLCTMLPVVDMSYKEIAEKLNEMYGYD